MADYSVQDDDDDVPMAQQSPVPPTPNDTVEQVTFQELSELPELYPHEMIYRSYKENRNCDYAEKAPTGQFTAQHRETIYENYLQDVIQYTKQFNISTMKEWAAQWYIRMEQAKLMYKYSKEPNWSIYNHIPRKDNFPQEKIQISTHNCKC